MAGLSTLVGKATKTAASRARKNAARDAVETAPVVRPQRDVNFEDIDVNDMDFDLLAATGGQIDREPIVIETWWKFKQENPKVQLSGTIEQQMDDVERALVESGELQAPDVAMRKEFDPERVGRAHTAEEERLIRDYLDPVLGEQFNTGASQSPARVAYQVEHPTHKPSFPDDEHMVMQNRRIVDRDVRKQLEERPELASAENQMRLREEFIQRDDADLATMRAFGKSKKAKGGRLDPTEENFSARNLMDDFFGTPDAKLKEKHQVLTKAEQAKQPGQVEAINDLLAEITAGSKEAGRKNAPAHQQTLPKTKRSFDRRPELNRTRLDKAQKRITGPMNEAARNQQADKAARQDRKTKILKGVTPEQAQKFQEAKGADRSALLHQLTKLINKRPRTTAEPVPEPGKTVQHPSGTFKQKADPDDPRKVVQKVSKNDEGFNREGITEDIVSQVAAPDSGEFTSTIGELIQRRVNDAQQGPLDPNKRLVQQLTDTLQGMRRPKVKPTASSAPNQVELLNVLKLRLRGSVSPEKIEAEFVRLRSTMSPMEAFETILEGTRTKAGVQALKSTASRS